MSKGTDVRVAAARLYFLPVRTRVPLKFGAETLDSVTCARAAVTVADRWGRQAEGWGETPLSVQWVWPSTLGAAERSRRLESFTARLARAWTRFDARGHALEVGHDFQEHILPEELSAANAEAGGEPMPWLAALVCCSAFDLALHDAYGKLYDRPVYETYGPEFLNRDLGHYLSSAGDQVCFEGRHPCDFLAKQPPKRLRAWHLVGGLDLLEKQELTGSEPQDGYPVLLADWIRRDGLKCLKVKLRGDDREWDYARLVRVGAIAEREGVEWLSADFNCMVRDPEYVNGLLDRLRDEQPRLYGMLLYVEQPFPYELETHPIDVHSVSARKPLFLDESAHNWRLVQRGRSLGWTGVALKTCKTQTGALLAACWAQAHGMALMVQDLTNPMLAQIPHCLLAAHTGTIMGVETNAMQFYPEASRAEAEVHPGLYRRRHGEVDLSTVAGPGFGYRLEEIRRVLPPPAAACENTGGGEPVRPDILWSRRPPRAVDPEDKPILTMSTLPPLILASASPRRAELLKQIGLEFGQLPTHVPEEQPEHLTPAEICQINSYHKARALAKKHPDALVLGADTLVCLGTRIFGKPASLAVAEEMLLELQGHEHQVITGVCLIHLRAHRQRLFAERTTVRFHRLSLAQVRVYLSRIDPLDKAGAYAIQEHGELIVERIDGSFSNVVGLPVERLQEVLAAWPREQAPSP